MSISSCKTDSFDGSSKPKIEHAPALKLAAYFMKCDIRKFSPAIFSFY